MISHLKLQTSFIAADTFTTFKSQAGLKVNLDKKFTSNSLVTWSPINQITLQQSETSYDHATTFYICNIYLDSKYNT